MKWNQQFLKENMMGPNAVRIAQELTETLPLKPGMRVMDLGCGRGLTSIFLAQTFQVEVFAVDLWISASDNLSRIRSIHLEDQIIPIHADAHQLPFAQNYFDAVISVDSYHYFGAEAGFLDQFILPYLKSAGLLAVAIPGLIQNFDNGVPDELLPYWQDDMNFYSFRWWEALWSQSEQVTDICAYSMKSHAKAWEDWLACDNEFAKRDIDMMKAEGGKYFDTIGITAVKK